RERVGLHAFLESLQGQRLAGRAVKPLAQRDDIAAGKAPTAAGASDTLSQRPAGPCRRRALAIRAPVRKALPPDQRLRRDDPLLNKLLKFFLVNGPFLLLSNGVIPVHRIAPPPSLTRCASNAKK